MRIFLKDVKYAWRSLFKRSLLTMTVALRRRGDSWPRVLAPVTLF